MDEKRLFTVGPVWVSPIIRDEMSRQMFSHRSPEYAELHFRLVNNLKRFMGTKNEIFIFTSSATGIMEACARNCVNNKVLNLVNGAFSERFSKVCKMNGKKTERVDVEWGKAIIPELVDEVLNDSDVEAVTLVHNETSTGVMNPLKEISKVVKKYDVLFFVDTVSSMGGTPINVDELGIDVCFFSVQKCMGIPPGLAIGSVSKRALEKSMDVENKGYYFNFEILKKYSDKNNTPATPAIPQILALNRQIELIFKTGLKKHFKKFIEVSGLIRESVKNMGLKVFPDERYVSVTMNCFESNPINPNKIVLKMKENGYIIANGYGKIKDKTFRIGNMSGIGIEDAVDMLQTLERVIDELR